MSLKAAYERFRQRRKTHEEASPLAGLRIERAMRCPVCKYDLEGLPESHTCPECGFVYEPDMLMFGSPKRKIWRIIAIAAIAFILIVPLIMLVHVMRMIARFGAPVANMTYPKLALGYGMYVAIYTTIFYVCTRPNWAIVLSDRIVWKAWPFRLRSTQWSEVTAIRFDAPSGTLLILGCHDRSFSWLSGIIRSGKRAKAMSVIYAELRRRWVICIDKELIQHGTISATDCKPVRATAIERTGIPKHCPTCRRPLATQPDKSSECRRCRLAFRPASRVFIFVERPIGPFDPMVLLLYVILGMATVFILQDVQTSLYMTVGILATVIGVTMTVLAFSRYRPRRARCLVIDDLDIHWESADKKTTRIPWNQIAAVAHIPDVDAIYLRLIDGDIMPVPSEFVPKSFMALEFAASIETARREYSYHSKESDHE